MKISSLLLSAMLLAAPAAFAGNDKTDICHVPPGNPSAARTISVAGKAVAAHLAHGDCLGACTVCGCGFGDVPLCGGTCHLCIDLSRSDCSLSAVSCCPPCQCPPGDDACCEETPRCCGGPEGPECSGTSASVSPADCGHTVCVE